MLLAILLTVCSGLLDPDEPGNLVPKTVAEDPLLPTIEVNGTLLHAEAFGDIHNPIMNKHPEKEKDVYKEQGAKSWKVSKHSLLSVTTMGLTI